MYEKHEIRIGDVHDYTNSYNELVCTDNLIAPKQQIEHVDANPIE